MGPCLAGGIEFVKGRADSATDSVAHRLPGPGINLLFRATAIRILSVCVCIAAGIYKQRSVETLVLSLVSVMAVSAIYHISPP